MTKALIAVILTLFASTAFAGIYPDVLPKNFQNAPRQTICERETPTAIHQKYYINLEEKWVVYILGRDGKNIYVMFMPNPEDPLKGAKGTKAFMRTAQGWKNIRRLTDAELADFAAELSKFTEEERAFFADCRVKAK